VKALFPYFGGKTTLAAQIIALMPPHRVYVEPYAGSAAVMLAKAPAVDVMNDANGNVVAFFRVLRDRPDELEAACRLTPYSRDEYIAADLAATDIDDLERARRFWVRSSQSFGGVIEARVTWSASPEVDRPGQVRRKLDRFAAAARRLLDVTIDNRDAIDTIRRYGTADAVIYADPPYPDETRAGPGGYATDEPGAAHHVALAEALAATPAAVIVSGYASPLYAELYAGWHPVTIDTIVRAGALPGEALAARAEVLWLNRAPQTDRLFA
jgi:DNA adenine methylase